MKKKIVTLLYLLIFISMFTVGFATWILSDETLMRPEYEYQPEFDFKNQNITYDGSEKSIVIPDDLQTVINTTNYDLPVYSIGGQSNVKPKDAGEYDVVFTSKKPQEYSDINIKFTIEPITIQFDYGIFNVTKQQRIPFNTKNMKHEDVINTTFLPDVKVKNLKGNDQCNLIYEGKDTELTIKSQLIDKSYTITGLDNDNYKLPTEKDFSIQLSKIRQKLKVSIKGVSNNILEKDYDLAVKSLSDLDQFFLNKIDVLDATSNSVVDGVTVTVKYIHNGYYLYGEDPLNLKFDIEPIPANVTGIIGSTYIAKVDFDDPNLVNDYELVADEFIFKYKTVNLGGVKYTIEDALAKGGSMVLDGDLTNFVTTSFTKINVNDLSIQSNNLISTVKSSSTLTVPYDSTGKDKPDDYVSMENKVYSALIVPTGNVVNVDKNASVVIGGAVANSGTVGQRGVIMNHGTMNFNGSSLYSYGFLKGSGLVNCTNSAKALDVFMMHNYPGGKNAVGMKSSVFPLTAYSFHNISCKFKIDGSSCFSAFYRQTATKIKAQGSAAVLGKDLFNNNNTYGLFKLDRGTDYIIKTTDNVIISKSGEKQFDTNFNNSIVGNNQVASQREILDIYGSFSDNSMTVSVGGQEIATNTKIAMPIGYMKISIHNNGNTPTLGTLSYNSYKFLPGSELNVDKGSTLKISSSINVIAFDETYYEDFIYYNDGKLIPAESSSLSYKNSHNNWFTQKNKEDIGAKININGNLQVDGGFGGKIFTNSAGATINLSKTNATIKILNQVDYKSGLFPISSSVTTKDFTDNTRVKIYQGMEVSKNYQSVSAGTYTSKGIGQNYGWFMNGPATLEYNTNTDQTVQPKNINIGDNGYIIQPDDLPNLQKDHYTFKGWYSTKTFDVGTKVNVGDTIYTGSVLNAKWDIITYNIDYVHIYENQQVSDNLFTNNNAVTFDFETNFLLNNPTHSGGYLFGGWYLDESFTTSINSVNGSTLVNYLAGDTVKIYAKWYPKGTSNFTVHYEVNNPDIKNYVKEDIVLNKEAVDYPLQDMTKYSSDYTVSKYFVGWKIKGTEDANTITGLTKDNLVNNEVTLVGVWANKAVVNVELSAHKELNFALYVMANQEITIPNVPKEALDPTRTFEGWFVTGGVQNGKLLQSGDSVVFANSNDDVITIKDVYMLKITIQDSFDRYVQVYDSNGNVHDITKNSTFTVKFGEQIRIDIYDKKLNWGYNTTTQVIGSNNEVLSSYDNKAVRGGDYRTVDTITVQEDLTIKCFGR